MISILITTKDRQDYLNRQVYTLQRDLAKSILPWEVIIFDDGSSTNLEIPTSDSRFNIIRSEINVGLIEARNILVSHSSPTSEYIFFLDDDIFIHNLVLFIEDAVKELSTDYSCVSAPYVNLPTYKYEQLSTFKHILDLKKTDENTVYFFGGTSIFRKSDFVSAGGLEGNYYIYLEEEDLALRMYALGMKIKIMYGSNYLAIHDQAPGKNLYDRRIYLLSNRFVFHYKFVKIPALRVAFDLFYVTAYLVKFRSLSLLKNAFSRSSALKKSIKKYDIKQTTLLKFLIKRYFNI